MAVSVSSIRPVAHLPLILGMLRKLDVASIIDALLPPNPANMLSCGRGVEALVLAILDGHHVLYKVGARLEARGMLPLLQAGLSRASLNDYRLGQILDRLFAANLNQVFGALALKALEVYALPTPWLHQDTTTIALYGAYEGVAPGDAQARPARTGPVPPRPAYGHSKDGRADLKQVLLSLGVSGDGGLPLRLGIRDGNTNDSRETPVAIEECLALGLDGVLGIVADSKAYSRRTLGLCCEKQIGLVTLVPRTCAVRQELEAWGRQQTPLPLLLEKPGRTAHDVPRRWRGRSVSRKVEVEYADKRIAWEEVRFVAVHSTQLASQQAQAYTAAQAQEAQRLATHIAHVATQRFACATDAEAAIAAYEGRERGRRGRQPQPWRYHGLQYTVDAVQQPKKRTRRGRPPKGEVPGEEVCYRLAIQTEALVQAEDEPGWFVLATTVGPEVCSDAQIVQAYREQTTTVEPGFRWIKNPAAIAPVWLEKPERIAALAMLTVVGLLVYSLLQRQVRLYLQHHDQQMPGNKGETATPTAAVILSLFAQVMMVQMEMDQTVSLYVYGLQPYHLTICDALEIDRAWYAPSLSQQNHGRSVPSP